MSAPSTEEYVFHPVPWRITTVGPASSPSTLHGSVGPQLRFNGAIKAPVVAFQRLAPDRLSRLRTRLVLPSRTIFSKPVMCPRRIASGEGTSVFSSNLPAPPVDAA